MTQNATSITELIMFQNFLARHTSVPQTHTPHYLRWISGAYAFLHLPLDTPVTQAQKEIYLAYLAQTHEQWQVRQADYAMRLYGYFLARAQAASAANGLDCAAEWIVLADRVREAMRLMHRARTTETTYLEWLRRFYAFRHKQPLDLTESDVRDFMSHLAVEHGVAAATQNQAFNALLFVFRHGLNKLDVHVDDSVRARTRRRMPVVLSTQETQLIFDRMRGTERLMAMLTYGAGLRLMECLRLRIKDIDLERGMVTVRGGKGDKDRCTLAPESLKAAGQSGVMH
jgi:hypothetical protein